MSIETRLDDVPFLTSVQMVEVDRLMIEDFPIELIQMMENAGRNLAHLARCRFLDGDPVGRRVTVLAGTVGNGGGALVAARRLHNWGAAVRVCLSRGPEQFTQVPRHQLDVLTRMRVEIADAVPLDDEPSPSMILDGLIGYSLRGAPRGLAADLIGWANRSAAPTLALDVPSGIDATSGTVHEPAIRATATMTLALPKVGLRAAEVAAQVGELYLADISVPPALYAAPGLDLHVGPLFSRDDVVRLR